MPFFAKYIDIIKTKNLISWFLISMIFRSRTHENNGDPMFRFNTD